MTSEKDSSAALTDTAPGGDTCNAADGVDRGCFGEKKALKGLLDLAYAAWRLADDAEDRGDGTHVVPESNMEKLCAALDMLDELPDDQPGYTMEAAAKASWALRRILAPNETQAPTAPEDAPAMRDAAIDERRAIIVLRRAVAEANNRFGLIKTALGREFVTNRRTGAVCSLSAALSETQGALDETATVGSQPSAATGGSMNTSSSNPLPQDAGELVEAKTSPLLYEVINRHRPAPNKGEG